MCDGVVDGELHLVGDARGGDLIGPDPQFVGPQSHAVVAGERLAHSLVAARSDVVDQFADRRPQVGVEDVVEPTTAELSTLRCRQLPPHQTAHHLHSLRTYRSWRSRQKRPDDAVADAAR